MYRVFQIVDEPTGSDARYRRALRIRNQLRKLQNHLLAKVVCERSPDFIRSLVEEVSRAEIITRNQVYLISQ